ncbi:hypothetical protein GRI89_12070 [Altererythrobacter salegens]|uniref:Acid phosphatase n=1 Tax=Croceibacterium salegens TaxID=1737568 RepID=A0A6I4SVX6_9SPHN|nr:hypothetical protein [Croceibacterium salegens]MXO60274.1 hypothetical protein [Croceibacterium salegens]
MAGAAPRSTLHRARALIALMLLPSLGGCVAAAALAVPSMTAIGAIQKGKRDKAEPVAVAEPVAAPKPASAQLTPGVPSANLQVAPMPAGPWHDFVGYTLDRASGIGNETASAILAQGAAELLQPDRQPCNGGDSAVIIDLDHGADAFVPETELRPAPGLADGLAQLRQAGVVVMWISRLDANRVDDVAAALIASGLDRSGRDPILLELGDADRKQTLRAQAAASACVLAIAGDQRQDFDELFGYLRDPNAAYNFDSLLGSGWFLVPDALDSPAVEIRSGS